jgi:mono/diheme cytochrome c family protein
MLPDQSENPIDSQGLHPDAPRHKSPIKWMALVALSLVALTTYAMWGQEKISIKATVTIPPLTASAQHGRAIFATACQDCHGVDGAGGSRKGQPLIHPMYRENQFPDFVFKKSIRDGKREKNWRFGPMPALDTLTEQQIDEVTEFVRAVQNASGID